MQACGCGLASFHLRLPQQRIIYVSIKGTFHIVGRDKSFRPQTTHRYTDSDKDFRFWIPVQGTVGGQEAHGFEKQSNLLIFY